MARIAFIGGGNMASAMIGGLLANGRPADQITVCDPDAGQRERLRAQFGVEATGAPDQACPHADVIVLAVKPQIIPSLAADLKLAIDFGGKLVLSIAAGTPTAVLNQSFGEIAIARAMPNTPALLGLGATGLYVNARASEGQRAEARDIVEAFGICVMLEREDLLDAVTAVSGSGPAYYFLMIEEMIRAGEALGLSAEDAASLTLQTALGAASMAAQGNASPAELRRRVTSPNGTTHAGVTALQDGGFGKIVANAMNAARNRALELGTL